MSKEVSTTPVSTMVIHNTRCRLCTSSAEINLLANRMLVAGSGYTEVVNAISPLVRLVSGMKPITYQIVKRHAENDFNFQNKALREIIRRRSTELQKTEDEGVERVINAVTVAEVIMAKGMQQVLEPGAVVTPTEALGAAKLHRELTKDEDSQVELAEINAQFARVIQAIQQVCSPEQMEAIVAIAEQAEIPELEYQEYDEDDDDEGIVVINASD